MTPQSWLQFQSRPGESRFDFFAFAAKCKHDYGDLTCYSFLVKNQNLWLGRLCGQSLTSLASQHRLFLPLSDYFEIDTIILNCHCESNSLKLHFQYIWIYCVLENETFSNIFRRFRFSESSMITIRKIYLLRTNYAVGLV